MSWKKIFCGVLAASMIFSATVFAAPDDSANAKLAKIETDTYGMEQSGALLDRISRLEKSYNGQNMTGNMNARIDAIYNVLYENNSGPGILAKINALEWNINHEVQSGGVNRRLESLENLIFGKINEGTFNERIRNLAKASFGAEILPITLVPVPENILIKVVTTVPVGSKTLQEGDTIPIKVVEDVFIDGGLVFANGLTGEGTVVNVHRAKNIFSNGKIETDFHTIKAIDGQDVRVYAGIEAIDAMTAESMARGLSLLGQTFSGKNKELEEVFVRGKNIDLPAGIELYLQIKTPIVIYGVKPGSSDLTGLSPEEMTPIPSEEIPTSESAPQNESGLLPDEMTITPPPEESPSEESQPEEPVLVQVDPETPAPPKVSTSEPPAEEGKNLEGYDGEIIEIIDED